MSLVPSKYNVFTRVILLPCVASTQNSSTMTSPICVVTEEPEREYTAPVSVVLNSVPIGDAESYMYPTTELSLGLHT